MLGKALFLVLALTLAQVVYGNPVCKSLHEACNTNHPEKCCSGLCKPASGDHGNQGMCTVTETIGFDDLITGPNGYTLIYNGYAGLNWNNVQAGNGQRLGVGYQAGVVSLPNVAFNSASALATISSISPETFTAVSVYATAAFNNGAIATFTAYQGGTQVGTISVTLSNTQPTLVVFLNTPGNTFVDITSLTFSGPGGYYDIVAVDNLVVTF
jgi:hypothetical protein